MPTVTINIAEGGTQTTTGEPSRAGHMWYELTDDQGNTTSYGFAQDAQHHGEGWAPGAVYNTDSDTYLGRAHTRTIEVSQAQFDAMQKFGRDPTSAGFDMDYDVLNNSCIDFTWKALEEGGLNPSGFNGSLWPTINIDDVDEIEAPKLDPGGETGCAAVPAPHVSPAARFLDPTVHLGFIIQGAPHTWIGHRPAARKGDAHICLLHGGGVIIQGATNVYIEGALAARQDDLCGCEAAGVAGAGCPAVLGPSPAAAAPKRASSDGKFDADTDLTGAGRGPHAEGELIDTDGDGTLDTARGEASMVRMRNDGYKDLGPIELGARHNMDVIYGRGQAGMTGNYGFGTNAGAEAGMLKEGGELLIGPAGDRGLNPFLAVGAEMDKWHAESKGDLLLGDDGRRVGLGAMGKIGAEVIGGSVNARSSTPIPFTDWTTQTRGKANLTAVASPGGGLGAWIYWDKAEGRLHIGALGKVQALFGAEVDVDFSIGRAYAASPAGATPGTGSGGLPNRIAFGCTTVLIGG